MATEVGNIHIGLYVDVGESRRFTDVANLVERDSRRMNTALGNTTRSVGTLRNSMNQNMRIRLASESLRDLSRATGEVERLRAAMLGISALAGAGITGAFTAAYLIQTADKARLLANQIKTVTQDTAEFGVVQDELFKISQRTRSSLESTTQIYTRAARATETYGMSQEKLLRLTETIQKSFAIGGATPTEATGAALQLSQGIASDRFGGDEYRSVAENAPVLLKGIADSLGVNIGKLREMSHAGELTAQVVTEAILKSTAKIDAAFAKMTPTVAQSFTMLDNTFLRYIGNTDEAYGVTKKLSAGIVSLSNNFEDVTGGITRVIAGLAAIAAARALTLKGQNIVEGIQTTKVGIRKEISDQVEANKAIDKRLAEISAAESAARAKVGDVENSALLKQSDAINAAKVKEFEAQKRVNELAAARATLADKLTVVQNASVVSIQKEVEVARQRVRDDQLRVIQAQEAAAAEERILQARLAQRLGVADQRVTTASGKVFDTLGRVGETSAAITAEKELAKTRLRGEIDARRQSLVTSAQRLSQIQSQIAEMRSIKDLPDFEQAFGGQYRRLLQDQQKAIISSADLRKEIDTLGQKLTDVDSGAAATRGISAAMTRHAAAVKRAQAAVESLAKAEDARNKVASAEVGGQTLQARIAAEAKEVEHYQKSIETLQAKMVDLRTATSAAFTGNAAAKMTGEIDALDKKIVAAQMNLRAASDAVATAQGGNLEMLHSSLEAQSHAAKEVNDLHAEAAALIERQVANTSRLEAAEKRLYTVRRVGSNVLGFFGGPTGAIITGALVAATYFMAKFAAESAEASEQTARIRKQLEDMGYLTKNAADAMSQFKTDVAEGRVSKLREEIKDFQNEMKKAIEDLNSIDVGGMAAQAVVQPLVIPEGTSSAAADKLQRDWLAASKKGLQPVQNKLADIRAEMIKNKGMSEEMKKSLEDMALANPDLSSISLSLIKLGEIMNGLRKASEDWLESIRKIRDEADKLPQSHRASEDQSMTNLDKMNKANVIQISKEVREANWTDYETHVHSIMDKLIKDAEKLGNVMSQSQARQAADAVIAGETAKKGLRDLIGLFEGTDKARGYNETLDYGKYTGGAQNLTVMTLREILDLQKQMLADPTNTKNSSAVGRYQITSQTLKDFMGQMGLSPDDVFSPEMQDRIADAIIRSTSGDISKLRGRWAGLQGATDEQIKTAAGQTFQNLPRLDESAQKWLDGMKDLDLKAQIQSLNEFQQQVVQTAQSMGVSREEVDKYIAAVNSGDIDKIPDKFKKIAASMKLGVDNGFSRQLQSFKDANAVQLLSDVDQKVVETAHSFGIAEDAIKAYVDAIRSGRLDQIPAQFAAIREEAQKMANIDLAKDVLSGGLTDIRSALEDGKITWEEWSNIAVNALNKVADKLQEMLIDQLFSSKSGFNIFSLFGSVGGVATGSSGVESFDTGGWTGPGSRSQVAGVVHAGEYVFDAASTSRIGIANLEKLRGYMDGGLVGMSIPKFDDGGLVQRLSGIDQMREKVVDSGGQPQVSVFIDMAADGTWKTHVKQEARNEVSTTGASMMHSIHNQYRRNQLPQDIRNYVGKPRKRGGGY